MSKVYRSAALGIRGEAEAFAAFMLPSPTRRQVLLGTFGALAAACATSRPAARTDTARDTPRSFDEIESRIGGRVGVFAVDSGSSRELAHRPDERFAMCSTFKWVLAAAVLTRVDRSEIALEDRVPYGPKDLLEYAPSTRENVAAGSMTVDALAGAAVTVSDNTAANLLLAKVGGPAGFTQFCRALGDPTTRLDRDEPWLNLNDAGDPRDTTSPRAMAGLMRTILCGDVLSPASRERLLGWLRACETGKKRLRAGLPADWTVGDKTGTGEHGAVNNVAIATPPGRAPILIAAYVNAEGSDIDTLSAAQADIARLVARTLAP